MSFQISKSFDLMAQALKYRSLRRDLISSNIANIDTPEYKSRDIDFEHALEEEKNKLYQNNTDSKLQLAKTNKRDLGSLEDNENEKPTIFFRDGQDARNDGNTVDLDVETTEMAKNTTIYNALTVALKQDLNIFKSVIEASSRV